MKNRRRGLFITLEGGEGVGKSTQLPLIAAALRNLGHDVVTTREPGGTPGAEALRHLLLFGDVDFSARAEIMVHFSARMDHVDRVIRPALESGKIVLSDRFFDSTLAYQGYGQGKGDPALIALISELSRLTDLSPDITLLFTADPEVTDARRAERGGKADRYEQAGDDFHGRVQTGFRAAVEADPGRFCKISANTSDIAEITDSAVSAVLATLTTESA